MLRSLAVRTSDSGSSERYGLSVLIPLSILLLLITGSLSLFLLFLIRGDLSPRIAAAKIRNRFSKTVPTHFPNFHDAPYRRLVRHAPTHHPVLLNLQTSEGTGQACHPDVAYARNGFGSKGWKYWLVCTPYPYANYLHENPELFASHNGIDWAIPDGLKNPLIASPEGTKDYNSDPDLLFVDGRLWLYFRDSRFISGTAKAQVWLTTSEDGAHWTAPVGVLSASGEEAQLMSPALVYKDGRFFMWTVDRTDVGLQIEYRDSVDGLKWSSATACSVQGLSGREPWHIDVIAEEDRLSALLVSFQAPANYRLHYAYSLDGGLVWSAGPFLLEQAYEFEEYYQYRSTLLKVDSNPDRYRIWYSASNRRLMHSIAHLEMVRRDNTLEPSREAE